LGNGDREGEEGKVGKGGGEGMDLGTAVLRKGYSEKRRKA